MKSPIGNPSEDALHLQMGRYLNVSLPTGSVWWHTPNQGARSKITGGHYKAMGMTAGVEDISILVAPHGFYFAVEVKAAKGRQTPEQVAREAAVNAAGGRYAVCRSVDELHAKLIEWGVAVKARMALR